MSGGMGDEAGSSAAAMLAAAAAASGVLGGWEVLATAEAGRVAERLEAAVAPLGAGAAGGAGPERGGAARGWAGWRRAPCSPPGGCSAARCSGSSRR